MNVGLLILQLELLKKNEIRKTRIHSVMRHQSVLLRDTKVLLWFCWELFSLKKYSNNGYFCLM